ncbi:hypothetical protein MNBD_GAMMA12-515 [hydrothermal vent metagenome]|uniref:Uncharacterized protein n=1 Tax=hydrothermal vent metagenome TaxID=652676 RepID=A0A3B0Y018_9ZZZZ
MNHLPNFRSIKIAILSFTLISISVFSLHVSANSKTDPNNARRNINTAIVHILALIDKKEITAFIKNYSKPATLKKC